MVAGDPHGVGCSDHPDRRFVEYLLRGMSQGFHIGFKHDVKECKRAEANMKLYTYPHKHPSHLFTPSFMLMFLHYQYKTKTKKHKTLECI